MEKAATGYDGVDGVARATSSPWYGKVFERCWRDRNRVGPGRVELPDRDFLVVAPRRTLRVLRPAPRSGRHCYESAAKRPESIDDGFFARWSRRPHPSGNCRCSFRQSGAAHAAAAAAAAAGGGTDEERIITAELNRIRTSLCEVEGKEGGPRDLEELERRVSVNLRKLRASDVSGTTTTAATAEPSAKHRIVKDLERYINALLEEILDDTVKHVARGIERNGARRSEVSPRQRAEELSEDSRRDDPRSDEPYVHDRAFGAPPTCEGYVNPAFVGSTDGLATLEDLDRTVADGHGKQIVRLIEKLEAADLYLGIRARCTAESVAPEQSDCVDSGINSVETIEFQPADQEPSFEQSLLRIIDEKLGRGPPAALATREDSTGEGDSSEGNSRRVASRAAVGSPSETAGRDDGPGCPLEDAGVHAEVDFGQLRLEFRKENGKEANGRAGGKIDDEARPTRIREQTAAIELAVYAVKKDPWPEPVTLRGNRKPTLVFLHGFGSTAEVFEHQLRYFSALGYPCVAPDMLGHGMSSAPGRSRDYHFGKLLKDLDAVLHRYAFKPGEKCVLVAHNYGCSFATALAYKYDANIHQLVLISGGGPTPLAPPSTESAGHCCLRAVLAPLLMCGLHRDILYSARGRQHPYCGQEPTGQWPSHMKHVLDGMIWPEGDYVFHRKIGTPTLLVHGLRDNKVSLVQECQMERTMMKAFLEAMPMAGHSPMTECPQQLNHMIHCFIDLWKNKKWKQ